VIVGISGAPGVAIGARIAERLAENPHCAVHLVVSPAAERTLAEAVDQIACRAINLLGLPELHAPARTWQGEANKDQNDAAAGTK